MKDDCTCSVLHLIFGLKRARCRPPTRSISPAARDLLHLVVSQGGASVAFPIMTLAFGIVPGVARDFSFMIQSAGMTAAAATIVLMQVQVEMHSLLWATAGGIFGIILGLEEVRRFYVFSGCPRVLFPLWE